MISENIELVLKGEKKDLYSSNLENALDKINKKVKSNINLIMFQNLISIYNLSKISETERFEDITINKFSGLPSKVEINKLLKEKNSNLKREDIDVVSKVKKALVENKDLSKIKEGYSKNKYFIDIKNLDSFEKFCDIKNTNNQILISNYENNMFVNYKIFFDEIYKENAGIFSSEIEKKIDTNSLDKPKYLNTMYSKLKDFNIIPNNLEKYIVGPFFTNKIEHDDYNLRSFVKEDGSYILEFKKQSLELNRVDINRKVLKIFNKKESVLEKNELEDFVIYSCSNDIKQELYDSLPKNENVMVI